MLSIVSLSFSRFLIVFRNRSSRILIYLRIGILSRKCHRLLLIQVILIFIISQLFKSRTLGYIRKKVLSIEAKSYTICLIMRMKKKSFRISEGAWLLKRRMSLRINNLKLNLLIRLNQMNPRFLPGNKVCKIIQLFNIAEVIVKRFKVLSKSIIISLKSVFWVFLL